MPSNEVLARAWLLSSLALHMGLDPVDEVGDLGVDPREPRPGTAVAPRHHTRQPGPTRQGGARVPPARAHRSFLEPDDENTRSYTFIRISTLNT